jgi:hypothetical protein
VWSDELLSISSNLVLRKSRSILARSKNIFAEKFTSDLLDGSFSEKRERVGGSDGRDALVLVSPFLHGVSPLGKLEVDVLLGVELFNGCSLSCFDDILWDLVGRSEGSFVGWTDNEGGWLAEWEGSRCVVDY